MTETVLFVGGSADGSKRLVNFGTEIVSVPILHPAVDEIKNETYIRRVLHLNSNGRLICFAIYLISTESPDNLIPLLIERYRKENSK